MLRLIIMHKAIGAKQSTKLISISEPLNLHPPLPTTASNVYKKSFQVYIIAGSIIICPRTAPRTIRVKYDISDKSLKQQSIYKRKRKENCRRKQTSGGTFSRNKEKLRRSWYTGCKGDERVIYGEPRTGHSGHTLRVRAFLVQIYPTHTFVCIYTSALYTS